MKGSFEEPPVKSLVVSQKRGQTSSVEHPTRTLRLLDGGETTTRTGLKPTVCQQTQSTSSKTRSIANSDAPQLDAYPQMALLLHFGTKLSYDAKLFSIVENNSNFLCA